MVPPNHVISVHDVANIYQVPQLLLNQNVISLVLNSLCINMMPPLNILESFNNLANKLIAMNNKQHHCYYQIIGNNKQEKYNYKSIVNIGIVGKYTGLSDSYLSVTKALLSASLFYNIKLIIIWIESSHLEKNIPFHLLKESNNQSNDNSSEENITTNDENDKECTPDNKKLNNNNNESTSTSNELDEKSMEPPIINYESQYKQSFQSPENNNNNNNKNKNKNKKKIKSISNCMEKINECRRNINTRWIW